MFECSSDSQFVNCLALSDNLSLFEGGAEDLALGGGQGDGGQAAAAGQKNQNTGFCLIS